MGASERSGVIRNLMLLCVGEHVKVLIS